MMWTKVRIKPDKNIWIKDQLRVDVSVRDTYNHDAVHLCGSKPELDGEIGIVKNVFVYPLDETKIHITDRGVQVFMVEVMLLGTKKAFVWNVELEPVK